MNFRNLILFTALTAAACGGKKDDDKKPATGGGDTTAGGGAASGETAKPGGGDTTDVNAMVANLATTIGVEPGALEPEAGSGADAALTARTGTVSVRRTGEDTFSDAPEGNVELHAGDQVRTDADSTAMLVLADESTVELAEESAIAIGDRNASADPASVVAVLAGVARFTVSPRGPGEGPFMVHTPGGVVAAKGTVFAIGVAATGVARVGVEEGEIEAAGRADLAAPVAVTAGNATILTADGKLEGSAQFTADDWGEWRDGAEAGAEPQVLVQAQVDRIETLEPQVGEAYVELEQLSTSVDVQATAAVDAEKANDQAAYEVVAEPLATDVEATYLASLRLQNLTFAMLSSAYLALEINARFPEQTEPVVVVARPRLVGALLWHKKFHVVVHHHVRPLRVVYYVHHPVGRARAVVVRHKVPAFYARVTLKPIDPVRVRGRIKVAVYQPPVIVKVKPGKRVWVTAPSRGWHARVKARPFKVRAAGNWYVRAAAPKAKVMTGVKVKARPPRIFINAKPTAIGKIDLRWGGGAKVKAVTGAKAKVGGDADVKVRAPGGGVGVGADPGAKVKVKVPPVPRPVLVKPGAVKAGVGVKAGAGVKAGGGVKAGTDKPKVEDKVKVKVKAPSGGVKIKGEAKGGIKLGP